uniref:CCHC-type domain-containing protein n=1 Tax=Tanacetum cinerariifolium TaxID=118510 RepID=A0A699H617_TANCI|nr:hypothetical protein [Tanacetum cinerariifolium]
MQKRRNDVKARTTLLLALPNEHQLRFSKYKAAQELWAAILKTFGGKEATKKTKKNLLKQQYGNFKAEGSETLEQTFNRLQAIVSYLKFMDIEIEQDDLNQKFLTSLAPEWLMHTIVWKNRSDLDTMSLDDLYNHLKVYEPEVQKKSESNSQNMAFISSAKNNSGNKEVNTASIPTASTQVSPAGPNVATASISLDTACAYIASQSNGFWKKTGKKISIQGTDVAGFDKSKVECFNCHKLGHFARECRAPRSKDRGMRDNYRQGSKVEEQAPKALMAIDGVGWDWSFMENEEENHALVANEEAPTEFALMAKSSSDDEVFDNSLCSKACRKNTDSLNSKITELSDKLSDTKTNLYHYKLGFQLASKDLDNLLESQRSKKNKEGLGCSVVPPLPAQVYSPPKKDMSWTGLPEFADDTITDYSRPSPAIESNSDDLQNKNPSVTETGASSSTILSKHAIKFVKAAERPTEIKTNKVKTIKEHAVKYAEMYRKTSKSSNGNSQINIDDKGYWDNGCSWHMTGNISYLLDYEPFDGGYVSFSQGGCKITGKGTIKTGKLEFKNVYFVKDLKYNLISVSQICDNKNSVLFTNSECIVLGRNFKLTDDTNVLLRTPRQHNLYSIDLNNVVPHKDLTCLVAKASADECMLWHRRLGHSNIKTMNRTLIEADAKLPVTFWAEAVNTACYVQNRVLVIKSQNKTPYELFNGRTPAIGFLKPFGCHVMILNTLDHLGKFDAKGDEGYFIGYSLSSKAIRVFNKRTKRVEENLHVDFLENKLIEKGAGPNWLFDIDSFTNSMNYVQVVVAGTNSTNFSSTKEATGQDVKKDVSSLRYIALPNWFHEAHLESSISNAQDACNADAPESSRNSNPTATSTNPPADHMETLAVETPIPTVSSLVLTACLNDSPELSSDTRLISKRVTSQDDTPSLDNILTLTNMFKDILGVTTNTDESNVVEANLGNIEYNISASPTPTFIIHKDHPKSQIISPVDTPVQTKTKSKEMEEQSFIATIHQKTDPALLQFCLFLWVRPIGTKWVLKNKKNERWIVIINKVRLVPQGHTQEEGIDYDEVFAPVARIEAIRLFLAYASFMGFTVYQMDVKSAFFYGTIDEEVYVMQPPGFQDLEFPARVYKVEKAIEFEALMHEKFQMSAMDELNFFLGLQVLQKKDGIFLSQDKSMIGSLTYLTASRPDIMFAVCACARHQVTPKECHLHAVKRIFRYLKGHLKLGLWYPKDSPFDLVAYSDSDYGGATQDRKSTTGGCQCLGRRLISWQYKKQTIVATSTTKAEYVAAASGYDNAADLLTKPFDARRFQYLVFWSAARIKTTDEGTKILATVDGKPRTISESSIRRNLKLKDEAGISSLPDAKLFENLTSMGYNILPNQKFSFQKATNRVYNFSKMIFNGIVQNVNNKVLKFLTYPRQYTRRARIAQSSTLPTAPDEPAYPIRDDSQGKACPTVSGLEAEQDRANITKTSILPSDSTPRVTSLAADEGSMQHKLTELMDLCTRLERQQDEMATKITAQDLKISALKAKIKHLDDRDKGDDDPSREDATINGRRLETREEPGIERSTDNGSNDTKEMVNVLTSLDASSILTSGVQVSVPPTTEVPIISSPLAGQVLTGSGVVPTASLIFTIAAVATPYSRRKEEGERFKRKRLRLEHESAKKVKTSEEVSEEDLMEMMQLVPVEEVYVEALQVKHPIIDWEIHTEGERSYWKIIRLGGSSASYQFFADILKHFDREDLNQLWALVKETLSIRPATIDKEKELWVELKR